MNDSQKVIFGIDLGTTYSCISHVDEHGKAVVIANSENQRITPSVVHFDDGTIVVGDTAKESAKLAPDDVVAFVKRSMGNENFVFENNGKTYSPEEISNFILRKLVQDAEQNLGQKVEEVVITCPAYFGINEREATKLAGEIAGLKVRAIINEPTAAAVAYGLADEAENKVVLIYDLGGGTFDVTMIHLSADEIRVICTGGDHNLGGKDWDDTIIHYFAGLVEEDTGISVEEIMDDSETRQELVLASEKAKQTLTPRIKAPAMITHGGERVKIELTRDKFEELTGHLLEKTLSLTHEMLHEAKAKGYDSFDEILLVGGSTRMPQVMERMKREFDVEIKLFDPDESVAKGAALYGWKLSIDDALIQRISHKTGKTVEEVQAGSEQEIAPEVLESAARELAEHSGFTLASVKSARKKVINVCSKSFGVVALDGSGNEVLVNLILKNASLPAEHKERFGTHEENQSGVDVQAMENELSDKSLDPALAVLLCRAELTLPEGLPAGSPIDISFKLNGQGLLEITALEPSQNRSVQTSVETSSVISGEALEEAKQRSKSLVVS